MHTPGPVVHWVSLVQGVQVLAGMVAVAVTLQIGVAPLQSLLVTHWTHWPMAVPLVAHTGLALVHGPVAPPAATPPSVGLATAPAWSQPTHWFCTQYPLAAFGQSLFFTHSTQRPEVDSHTEVLPEHALPPSGPLSPAQETQVFCAEQKGTPAALLHWVLVLHATHLAFTQ